MPENPEINCCGKPLEFKLADGAPWQTIPETAICDACHVYYERKPGSKVAYRETNDGFKCTGCDKATELVLVSHAIQDGPWPKSGSGRINREEIRHCPNCEEEPRGKPVEVSSSISYML